MQESVPHYLNSISAVAPYDAAIANRSWNVLRFWLQNAFKLSSVLPESVSTGAATVWASAPAVHACLCLGWFDDGPQGDSGCGKAQPTARPAAAIQSRIRHCCAAAFAALPNDDIRGSLAVICAPADSQQAHDTRSNIASHALLRTASHPQRDTAALLAVPALLSGLLVQTAGNPGSSAALQHAQAPAALAAQLAALPTRLTSPLEGAALLPRLLSTLAADMLQVVAEEGPLAAEAAQALMGGKADLPHAAAACKAHPLLCIMRSQVVSRLCTAAPARVPEALESAWTLLGSAAAEAALCAAMLPDNYAAQVRTCAAVAADVWAMLQHDYCEQLLRQRLGSIEEALADPVLCLALSSLLVSAPQHIGSKRALTVLAPGATEVQVLQQAVQATRWALKCGECDRQSAAYAFFVAHCAAAAELAAVICADCSNSGEVGAESVLRDVSSLACELLAVSDRPVLIPAALALLAQVCQPLRWTGRSVLHDKPAAYRC